MEMCIVGIDVGCGVPDAPQTHNLSDEQCSPLHTLSCLLLVEGESIPNYKKILHYNL